MFSKPNQEGAPDSTNIIRSGTVIEGDIKTASDIRIEGNLKGTLDVKGKLVIGATGNIEGDINCQNAEIYGNVTGKVRVTELLSLKANSKLSGEITTGKLSIEPGATFSGTCSMGGVIKEIKNAENASSGNRLKEKTA